MIRPATPQDWFHLRATHYVSAQILFHLNQAGVINALHESGPASAEALAAELGLDARLLGGLLDYIWKTDSILTRGRGGRYGISSFGRRVLDRFARREDGVRRFNLFDVRVGAYGPVWAELGGLLSKRLRYGRDIRRRGGFSADGLYKLSGRLFPALNRLVGRLRVAGIVELGAGSGLLQNVAKARPDLAAMALDRNAAALSLARSRAGAMGPRGIRWVRGDAFSPGAWRGRVAFPNRTAFFSCHFHEFLAAGQAPLLGLLRRLRTLFPGSTVIALEEPRLPPEARKALPESRWLYSQSNVLIHELVGKGRILTEGEWVALFREAGCACLSAEATGYLGYRAFTFRL